MSGHDEREDYDDRPSKGPLAPEHVVHWPATAMTVIAWVQLLCTVLGFPFGLALIVTGPRDDPGNWPDILRDPGFHNLVAICVAGVVANLVTLRGAAGMNQFRRYPWAVAAAVLTAFALPCVYFVVLTGPAGVWALVVLLRRDVRARFEAVARGNIQARPPDPTDVARP